MLIFAIVMIIILLAPILIKRMKIPGLVGIILAGTLVGPSMLGLLHRDQTIILLGTVGLLYLMFTAGLSIDLNKFQKNRNNSIVFGLISFFLPQLLALPVGIHLLGFSLESSLLLGAIVGSHTLLAYPIANRLGITKNEAVTTAMGGTIVTDMLSLTLLAIVANTVSGSGGTTFWITFAVMVVIYASVVLLGLPRLGTWFFRNVRDQANTQYVFLIAILFITAFLAEQVGLAAIIGAFLAGLTLNRLVPESGTLMSRVVFVGEAYFIPFFLISVGMLIDVSVMFESWDIWLQAGLFSLLVVFGKGIAAMITKLIYGYSMNAGWSMVGLTIPQAAATLAVTLVGFEIGMFTQTSVNAVVMMILITCIIGPAIVEKYGRQLAIEESKKPFSLSEAPERILIPLANPNTAEALMDIAMIIKSKNAEEPLFPLTVVRDSDNVSAQVAGSEKMLSHAVVHAAAAETPVLPVTRVDMNISNGIMRAVKELRISHIVIGWNGEISARQRIFGSILDQLLDESDQLVMVCKIDHPINTTKRVVLMIPPYLDREPGFLGAVMTIKNLVIQIGADLLVVRSRNNQKVTRELIEKQEPEIEAEFLLLEKWSDLLKDERIAFTDEDLILLLSTREGTVSWEPGLERLPRIIAQNYPKVNFLTIYPTEIEQIEAPTHRIRFERSLFIPNLETENVNFELDDVDAETALRELIQRRFKENPIALGEIVNSILETDTDNLPGELPGVVLTKTRSDHVNEPTLFFGISKQGLQYPGIEEEVFLLFVLVTPTGHPTQRNLNILANLARILGSRKTVKKLREVTSMKEINETLRKAQGTMNSIES